MSNEGLARSAITIGKRAQEYGQTERITTARRLFSFAVDSNRLADISFSARSRPDFESFVKSRVGIWWWSDPDPRNRPTYEKTIEEKIQKAADHDLVRYYKYVSEKKAIVPGSVASILRAIGSYDRSVFENVNPFMSRKIRSAFGSYVTDLIFNEYPDINEVLDDVRQIRFECPRIYGSPITITGESLLSQLESLSVIRRVGDKFLPFYAYEIFGTEIERLLEENVFDSHLDVIKNMIMKMPGLARATLMEQLPGDARKNVVEKALDEMWKNKLIYIIKTENTMLSDLRTGPKQIIIPTWFLHFIMDRKPELVQTEAFILTMISLSWFWESMRQPLEEFDDQIDNFNQFVSSICGGSIGWRDIFSLGAPITNLAWTMSKTGLLLDKIERDETFCLEQSQKVLIAIQDALRHSYDSEIWFGGLSRSTSTDQVTLEIQKATKEIDSRIFEKWRPRELTATIPDFQA